MEKRKKISIITACYNTEATIEQTIQSVINQTYDNIEYIIVDGASTDGTMDVVNKYKEKIDVIISEPDEGIYDAFNKGAKLATGDYVQYLNADDYLLQKDVIESIANKIIEENDPVILYGGILMKNEVTGHIKTLNKEIPFEKFQQGFMLPHPATFLKREILVDYLFDTQYKIASDYDLISKVYSAYQNQVKFTPIVVTLFRLGGVSSNLHHDKKLNQEVNNISQKNFNIDLGTIFLNSNENYLKVWISNILFKDKSIADVLNIYGIKNVALFGSGEIANLIAKDLTNNRIKTICFLDNDDNRQGLQINNIPIYSPEWLTRNKNSIDTIILAFEGNHEASALEQLSSFNLIEDTKIFSWRELIAKL